MQKDGRPQLKHNQATDIRAASVGNCCKWYRKNVLGNTPDMEQIWLINPAVSFPVSEENPPSQDLTCKSQWSIDLSLIVIAHSERFSTARITHVLLHNVWKLKLHGVRKKLHQHTPPPPVCLLSCYFVNYLFRDDCICNIILSNQGKWVVR